MFFQEKNYFTLEADNINAEPITFTARIQNTFRAKVSIFFLSLK
jgi:hypothetical protein